MRTLYEIHRPTDWPDVVGQSQVVQTLTQAEKAGRLARHWYFAGKSGTGKTSICRIIAGKLAHGLETIEVVGRGVTVSDVREWRHNSQSFPMFGKHRVVIINEAHGLSKAVVEELLDFLESPKSTIVLFTTTSEGDSLFDDSQQDAGPFKSRVCYLAMASNGFTNPAADHIAAKTGIPAERVRKWMKYNGCNMREAWQAVEMGSI